MRFLIQTFARINNIVFNSSVYFSKKYDYLEEVGDRTMVTLSRSYHGGLTPGVMADQRKTLADTSELTDTVYFVHPTGI